MNPVIMTVVGARPQFIKAAVVSHELEKRGVFREEIIHTGQHFDANMSQAFFDELDIPEPVVNLGVSGGSHAEMTARMLIALENEMVQREPRCVLLCGDTNSTLAAALAAAKLHLPVVHVEAGARTFSRTNPEEINRICVDHVSDMLLACTERSVANLVGEGLGDRCRLVGDPMFDAFAGYSAKAQPPRLESILDGTQLALPERFYYVTCHREENTADDATLLDLLLALQGLDAPSVYPVHPRNRANARRLSAQIDTTKVLLAAPVGYLESVYLTNHCEQVVTDSGGLQREAFFAGKKCTTVLGFEVWPETMVAGRNILAAPNAKSLYAAISTPQSVDEGYRPFGDGRAAEHIVDAIEERYR